MAPTIQVNANNERDHHHLKSNEKRSDLICRVKYCNTLPDIPFDPKFLVYPFESNRFVGYNPTSLERNYKFELLTEPDLGVNIDLINPETYTTVLNKALDPADEKLLEEDVMIPQDIKRSRHHAKSVSWLRRTEYISTEHTRFQPQMIDKVEAKVGYNVKKMFKEENLYMDRASQVSAIEKTFTDAQKIIKKHYSKPNIIPTEILPIFPDFQLWKYPCAQVIFDSDPAPLGHSFSTQLEEMSQAMIRGVMDESGEQFVAYFLPTSETLQKRLQDVQKGCQYEDDEEYDYKMAREYNWNVKNKASRGYEENYFFVIRADGVYYNELETRVRLSKRRLKPGVQPNNSRLIVKHRPLSIQEINMQRYREKLLETQIDEEEEDYDNRTEGKEIKQQVLEEEKNMHDQKTDSSSMNSDNESQKSNFSSHSTSSGLTRSSSSQGESDNELQKKNENDIFGSDTD